MLRQTYLLFGFLLCSLTSFTQPSAVRQVGEPSGKSLWPRIVEDIDIVTRDGAELSATRVLPKKTKEALPTIFIFNIYATQKGDLKMAERIAKHGYAAVVVNTRGKRRSSALIEPFAHDANDVYDAIDWIAQQPWSNGEVGMMGGSYLGFSQWAAAKTLHPALKTIVPQVAVGSGIDFPTRGSIHMTYMLRWIQLVSSDSLTDLSFLLDRKHRIDTPWKWFKSGRSFRSLDTISGQPSSTFQTWLDHPAFDGYWQKTIPHEEEFARIDIPVLTMTGYFDGDQLGALYYLKQHYQYNPQAEHYLTIGPYHHLSAQSKAKKKIFRHKIDPVAQINATKLAFEWFDYILKGGAKPALLQDRVNFQIMGTNTWGHATRLDDMANDKLVFHLTTQKDGLKYRIQEEAQSDIGFIDLEVDMGDTNVRHYGSDISSPGLGMGLRGNRGVSFISEPLEEDLIFAGPIAGTLVAEVNKFDIDYLVEVFEVNSEGRHFFLSSNLQRASYALDRSKRQLLTPGERVVLPINNAFMGCKQLSRGNKIRINVNINKNEDWEVNYGSGKPVADETIEDAGEPLLVKWSTESFLELPIRR